MLNANLEVYQGDDVGVTVTVKNADGTAADLTGFTAKAQVRLSTADQSPIAAEFATVVTMPNLVVLSLTNAQTVLLTDAYYWDVQIKSGAGLITTLAGGRLTVKPEVTREVVTP